MRVLHIFAKGVPTLAELRAPFAHDAAHTVVLDEGRHVPPDMAALTHPDFPPLSGKPTPMRLRRIGAALAGFDLVLTHGYGAIDAALAHTLFGQAPALPALVHHEDHADAARSRRRDWYRRIALGRAAAVIVPTERLRAIALADWQQPATRVQRVAPGIDMAAFARKPRPDALPRLIKRTGERWLGALGDDGDPAPLLEALGGLPDTWQLVWIGDGAAREAVRAAAMARDLAHRVHTPGAVSEPDAFGLLDLIALAPDATPTTVATAMAAGLAIAAPADETFGQLLCPDNAAVLGAAIGSLASDDTLRRRLGEANRARAQAKFGARRQAALRGAIYAQAIAQAGVRAS